MFYNLYLIYQFFFMWTCWILLFYLMVQGVGIILSSVKFGYDFTNNCSNLYVLTSKGNSMSKYLGHSL